MSTKIYNAYKIKAKSLDEVFAKLKIMQKDMEKQAATHFKNFVSNYATAIWCDLAWGVKTLDGYNTGRRDHASASKDVIYKNSQADAGAGAKLLSHVLQHCTDFVQSQEASDMSFTNFKAEGVVIPRPTSGGGRECYLLYFGPSLGKDILDKQEFLGDFSYWNNADPPDEFTHGAAYRKWENRGQVWEEILGAATPAEAGLTLEWLSPQKLVLDNVYRPTFTPKGMISAFFKEPSEQRRTGLQQEFIKKQVAIVFEKKSHLFFPEVMSKDHVKIKEMLKACLSSVLKSSPTLDWPAPQAPGGDFSVNAARFYADCLQPLLSFNWEFPTTHNINEAMGELEKRGQQAQLKMLSKGKESPRPAKI